MSASGHAQGEALKPWLLAIGTILLTAMVTIAIIARSPVMAPYTPAIDIDRTMTAAARQSGSPLVIVTVGDRTIERELTSASFVLEPGEALDARLPAGAMTAFVHVPVRPAKSVEATVGARIRGGSFICRRSGDVLSSSAAGDEPKTELSTLSVRFGRSSEPLIYEITWSGETRLEFRAVWRPADRNFGGFDGPALRIPVDGRLVVSGDVGRGRALAQQYRCIACHATDDAELASMLTIPEAPRLGDLGTRVNAQWLRDWIDDPSRTKPGAHMPSMLHGRADATDVREDLVHFLMAQRTPKRAEADGVSVDDTALIGTGEILYHDIGCQTCHGPRTSLEELPGGRTTRHEPIRPYVELPDLHAKTNVDALAFYLEYPLTWHPDGRMPGMRLTPVEARSLAAYLIRDTRRESSGSTTATKNDVNVMRAARGSQAFVQQSCHACHDAGDLPVTAPLDAIAPALDDLTTTAFAGCLDDRPITGVPHFDLSSSDRAALRAFLDDVQQRDAVHVPLDALAMNMQRLNCLACHRYHDAPGPEPAVRTYFASAHEADLGDEGRIPPDLTDVGARLTIDWMHGMLHEAATVRPWMSTRMPQFGEGNVRDVPAGFVRSSGLDVRSDTGAAVTPQYADIGRELVGQHGFNCIQCHNVAGFQATGSPGPDLADAAERLRHDAFVRWLYDPAALRPGTRMPSYFAGGRSPLTDVLDGTAEAQIDAMWAYVAQGDAMPLPDGIQPAGGLLLDVREDPIIVRTFMDASGVRAIACGYPEQIHAAYDAENCQLAVVWTGVFLDASAAWANRGGSETNPSSIAWRIDDVMTLDLETDEDVVRRFRGYRLDDRGRPTFRSQLVAGDVRIDVSERFDPITAGDSPAMQHTLTLDGPPNALLRLRPAGRRIDPRSGIESNATMFRLDASGRAVVVMEVTW